MRKPKQQQKPLNDLSRSLTPFDPNRTLIIVIELSKECWLVAGIIPGVERQPLKKLEPNENELLKLFERWRVEAEKARAQDRPHCHRIRDRPGRLLASTLAESSRHRSLRHSCCERGGVARAPACQDRSAGHQGLEARLSRLAARRTGALQDGGDANTC